MRRYLFLQALLCLFVCTQCRKHDDPQPKKNTLVLQFSDGTTHTETFDGLTVGGSHDPSWYAYTTPANTEYSFGLDFHDGGGQITFDSTITGTSNKRVSISNGTNTWVAISGILEADYTPKLGGELVKLTFNNLVFRDTSITGPMRTFTASGNLVHKNYPLLHLQ